MLCWWDWLWFGRFGWRECEAGEEDSRSAGVIARSWGARGIGHWRCGFACLWSQRLGRGIYFLPFFLPSIPCSIYGAYPCSSCPLVCLPLLDLWLNNSAHMRVHGKSGVLGMIGVMGSYIFESITWSWVFGFLHSWNKYMSWILGSCILESSTWSWILGSYILDSITWSCLRIVKNRRACWLGNLANHLQQERDELLIIFWNDLCCWSSVSM